MNLTTLTIILITIFSLIHQCVSYTQALPKWLTSPFLRAGNQQVIRILTGNDQTPTYIFTFSSPLTDIPKLAYGLKAYKGNDFLGVQQFSIERLDLNRTNFKVEVQIYGKTNVRILTVAYLAVQPSFPHHLNTFDNIPVNYTSGDIVNISNQRNYEQTFTEVINYTDQASGLTHKRFMDPIPSNKILLLMTTIWIWGDWTTDGVSQKGVLHPIQLTITPTVLNHEEYSIEVKTYRMVKITKLHFSQVIFNYNDVRSSNAYQLNFQVWENGAQGAFHEVPMQFVDNFIMGLLDFSMIFAKCVIFYTWDFAVEDIKFGVRVGLMPIDIGNCSFSRMRSSVFYMRTWECPKTHPYYNTSSKVCQDECAIKYYQDRVELICYLCQQSTCYSCANNLYTCLQCDTDSFLLQNGTCRQSYCANYPQINSSQYSYITRLSKTKNRNQVIFDVHIVPLLKRTVDQISVQYINSHINDYSQSASVNYTLYKDYISFPSLSTILFVENSTLRTSFTYKDDIEGMKIPFNYSIKIPLQIQDGQICYKFLYSTVEVLMQTENNVPLTFQTLEQSQERTNIQLTLKAIAVFSLVFVLIGFFASAKIVGLQHSGVLQLAFFSVSDYQKINPIISSLADMKYLNGYNTNFMEQYSVESDQQLPSRILGINYSSYFLENCNILTFLMITVLVLGISMHLFSKLFKKVLSSAYRTKVIAILLIDIGLTLVLFNLFNVSFSAALHIKYASFTQQFHSYYIASTVFMITCLVIPLIYGFVIIFSKFDKGKSSMGQYCDKFKKTFECRNYIAFTIFYRFSVAIYMATKTQYQLSTLIVLAFSLGFLMYNLVNLPFTKAYHNYRAMACHITHFYILFITMFYRSMKSNDPRLQVLQIKWPIYGQIGLVILCTTVSAICLSYDVCISIKARFSQLQKTKYSNHNNIPTQSQNNIQDIIFQRAEFQTNLDQNNKNKQSQINKKKQVEKTVTDDTNFVFKEGDQTQEKIRRDSSQNISLKIKESDD